MFISPFSSKAGVTWLHAGAKVAVDLLAWLAEEERKEAVDVWVFSDPGPADDGLAIAVIERSDPPFVCNWDGEHVFTVQSPLVVD